MEQIGRYRILGELGRGAMGVVYRAQDPAIGRIVAIKTIRLSDLTDVAERERLRDRLFREAQSAGMLSHPNIVTIYDVAEENGTAYISMECVNGPPLEKLFSARELPEKERVLSYLRQTAAALDYAHAKGIVHRDIKPANIMVHEGLQAKITDFGVAKILSQQMTVTGTMMGTPNYMSPEQVQGHDIDGRADQFALAVIAYEVLTGEKPFVGDYLPTLLYKIVREDPVAPQRINPTLSADLEQVLRKALAKDPDRRFATCAEFLGTLTQACHASPNWQPMARGLSQSMPTIGGTAISQKPANPAPEPVAGKVEPAPVLPPPRGRSSDEAPPPNPLVKSLLWMLVGLGLVGLVLLGAQRYLFNRVPEPAPPIAAVPQPPEQPPVADNKPSPMPPLVPDNEKQDQAPAIPPDAANQPMRTKEAQSPMNGGQPARSEAERTVQFLTDPPGATVTVDNNSATSCKTPCLLPLTPGRHVLNAGIDGYRPYPKVINVPQDSDVFLQLSRAAGTLSITSSPPGAVIQVNGQEQAKRTPALINVAPGTYHIRVIRDGVPLDFDVAIKDGEFINKNVSF